MSIKTDKELFNLVALNPSIFYYLGIHAQLLCLLENRILSLSTLLHNLQLRRQQIVDHPALSLYQCKLISS